MYNRKMTSRRFRHPVRAIAAPRSFERFRLGESRSLPTLLARPTSVLADIPDPVAGAGEVVAKVAAAD